MMHTFIFHTDVLFTFFYGFFHYGTGTLTASECVIISSYCHVKFYFRYNCFLMHLPSKPLNSFLHYIDVQSVLIMSYMYLAPWTRLKYKVISQPRDLYAIDVTGLTELRTVSAHSGATTWSGFSSRYSFRFCSAGPYTPPY